ncbi:hypothetical protein CDAR_85751 [Caerostris darwini]|uniref:Uncharacterized protein n=1 Tax=Caerostris darwini TaxID=1538125 RepID=A0AAV4MZV2_9ARAC|nr:hypothetical protein CDAR_85751 [Caerostris darwini]
MRMSSPVVPLRSPITFPHISFSRIAIGLDKQSVSPLMVHFGDGRTSVAEPKTRCNQEHLSPNQNMLGNQKASVAELKQENSLLNHYLITNLVNPVTVPIRPIRSWFSNESSREFDFCWGRAFKLLREKADKRIWFETRPAMHGLKILVYLLLDSWMREGGIPLMLPCMVFVQNAVAQLHHIILARLVTEW